MQASNDKNEGDASGSNLGDKHGTTQDQNNTLTCEYYFTQDY